MSAPKYRQCGMLNETQSSGCVISFNVVCTVHRVTISLIFRDNCTCSKSTKFYVNRPEVFNNASVTIISG
jgi:hypothetical protein